MTDKNKGISPMAAAVAGAVVGAGVAVAGAIALEDKKNRNKVNQVLTGVKKQVKGYIRDAQTQVRDERADLQKKFSKGKEKVNRIVKSVKKSANLK